jgi:hypothetical protein
MTRQQIEGMIAILLVVAVTWMNLYAYGKWGLLTIPWFGFCFWLGMRS